MLDRVQNENAELLLKTCEGVQDGRKKALSQAGDPFECVALCDCIRHTSSHVAGLAMEKLSRDGVKIWIFLFEHLFFPLLLLSNIYITKVIKVMDVG